MNVFELMFLIKMPCRHLLLILAGYSFLLLYCLASFSAAAESSESIDMIWVQKADRKLHLMAGQRVVRSYTVSLGENPRGHKQREGDSRTPEGLYFIDGRNEASRFFLSLHISYPSLYDWQRAVRSGLDPGGYIMIHGEPDDPLQKEQLRMSTIRDWTDGCIALNNVDMAEVWSLVRDGTPILIDP